MLWVMWQWLNLQTHCSDVGEFKRLEGKLRTARVSVYEKALKCQMMIKKVYLWGSLGTAGSRDLKFYWKSFYGDN